MDNTKQSSSNIFVEKNEKLNQEKIPTFESYLEKKARNIFSGWQKRYFVLLEGKIIMYTETKESKQVKGYFLIKKISDIKPLEENNFLIETEGRKFLLRAENENIKNNWIEKIKTAFTNVKKGSLKENNSNIELSKIKDLIIKTDEKSKLNSIGIKTGNIIF